MLEAINQIGDRIPAKSAEKGIKYFCPKCGEALIFKHNTSATKLYKKVAHFAHYPDSDCPFAKGEGPRHEEMKEQVATLFQDFADIAMEVYDFAPQHIADLVINGKIVVECQQSPISKDEWDKRTKDYNQHGYPVLWIWDIKRLGDKNASLLSSYNSESEYRVPVEVRYCHQMSYGKIYVLDNDGYFTSCHLGRAGARYSEGGPDWDDNTRIPISLKYIRFHPIQHHQPVPFYGPNGHLLINFNERVWWK